MADSLEIFIYKVFPLTLLIGGLIGNICGVITMRKKVINKVGPRLMYQLLFVVDSLNLLIVLNLYLSTNYGLDVSLVSNLSCKIYMHLNGSLSAVSPFILCYISLDRLVLIKIPAKRQLLHKTRNQFAFVFFLVGFSLIYYSPVYYGMSMTITTSQTNNISNPTSI